MRINRALNVSSIYIWLYICHTLIYLQCECFLKRIIGNNILLNSNKSTKSLLKPLFLKNISLNVRGCSIGLHSEVSAAGTRRAEISAFLSEGLRTIDPNFYEYISNKQKLVENSLNEALASCSANDFDARGVERTCEGLGIAALTQKQLQSLKNGRNIQNLTSKLQKFSYKRNGADIDNESLAQAQSLLPVGPDKLKAAMHYGLLSPGKRLRPILTLMTGQAFFDNLSTERTSAALSDDLCMAPAVAVEIVHAMTLVHDDLPAMDNDSFRRGIPTNHKLFGESMAILAGDALLAKAYEHLVTHMPRIAPAKIAAAVIRVLSTTLGVEGLAGGQVLDIECTNAASNSSRAQRMISDFARDGGDVKGKEVDEALVQLCHLQKTGSLLRAAVLASALATGCFEFNDNGDIVPVEETQSNWIWSMLKNNENRKKHAEEVLERLMLYATNVGLAYQISDDLLDATQNSHTIGKTAGKDAEQNKLTYVKIHGIQKSTEILHSLVTDALDAIEILDPINKARLRDFAFFATCRSQ